MARVLFSTGSNLGNRLANLRAVETALSPAVRVRRGSRIYETIPWGLADQPTFLNQALEGETELTPVDLLALCKQAEKELGRVPAEKNGPRVIDIDILFYGEQILHSLNLELPHPRMLRRGFVLRPLAELAPGLVHPEAGRTIAELAEETEPRQVWLYKHLAYGSRTFVMGILNITPDSFSGDGLLHDSDPMDALLQQARSFVGNGADILDIGGESTRPGGRPVSAEEEMARVLPMVRALVRETSAVISVDTAKAAVAEAALREGADWINDVWGLRADERMGAVCARAGCSTVLMHNRSNPASAEIRERLGGHYEGIVYGDLLGEVRTELLRSVELARAAGMLESNLILDPGIGFGKTIEQNLELLRRLDEIKALGRPLLLGASRKSVVGYTLDLPPEERLEGSLAAAVLGIQRGADILRVHDVRATVRAARFTDAVVRAGRAG